MIEGLSIFVKNFLGLIGIRRVFSNYLFFGIEGESFYKFLVIFFILICIDIK